MHCIIYPDPKGSCFLQTGDSEGFALGNENSEHTAGDSTGSLRVQAEDLRGSHVPLGPRFLDVHHEEGKPKPSLLGLPVYMLPISGATAASSERGPIPSAYGNCPSGEESGCPGSHPEPGQAPLHLSPGAPLLQRVLLAKRQQKGFNSCLSRGLPSRVLLWKKSPRE